jgi:hypothetical protein
MLLAAFLLIGAPQAASLQDEPTRSELMSSSRQFFAGTDADGDGTLSLAEWTGMVSEPGPGEGGVSQLRAYLIAEHRRMDRDRDGKVTFDELIREPLANFDCMDADRNLRLSQMEIESGRKRCPSGPAIRIGFISEPPDEGPPTP